MEPLISTVIAVYNYILPSKMRENGVFLVQFLVLVKTKDSRTPPTCSSQHFFSFSILQCKCDRQNTGHPWVLVMWEWGWEFFKLLWEPYYETNSWSFCEWKHEFCRMFKSWLKCDYDINVLDVCLVPIWVFQKVGSARKCGSSRSPHHARFC